MLLLLLQFNLVDNTAQDENFRFTPSSSSEFHSPKSQMGRKHSITLICISQSVTIFIQAKVNRYMTFLWICFQQMI